MLKSPLLFSISVLVTLFSWSSPAQAEESTIALSFALPSIEQKATEFTEQKSVAPEQKSVAPEQKFISESSYSLQSLSRQQESLPAISDTAASNTATSESSTMPAGLEKIEQTKSELSSQQDIGVQFLKDTLEMPRKEPLETPLQQQTAESSQLQQPETTYEMTGLDDWIFEGGSRSLVAHTVGSAEGTRHWSGRQTRAYYGHTDPGNGVWNLGTFSYQHEASSPEDADGKQLKRLKAQGILLEEQASQKGIRLSLQEKLNGLDLANQAPLAALGEGGYIDRLEQAYRLQLSGEEAIAWARTRAYIDPDTRTWNAPGLGNNLYSISKDQERRMAAIDKALRAYDQTDHTGLELARLEAIQLEGSQLEDSEGVSLARTTAENPSFDGVAEAFRLAAHDISIADVEIKENTLAAAAVSFELPAYKSDEALSAQHNTEVLAADESAMTERAERVAASEAAASEAPETTQLQASSSAPESVEQAVEELGTAIEADISEADISEADISKADISEANTHAADIGTPVGTPEIEAAIALTFVPDQTHLLAQEAPAQEAASQITAAEQTPDEALAEEPEQEPTLTSLLNSIPARATGETPDSDPPALTDISQEPGVEGQLDRMLLHTEDRIVRPQSAN